MEVFRPQRWLRLFGILASATIAVRHVTDRISAGPEHLAATLHLDAALSPAAALRAVLAVEALAYAGFLGAFLYTTRTVEPQKPRVFPILILLIQLPL